MKAWAAANFWSIVGLVVAIIAAALTFVDVKHKIPKYIKVFLLLVSLAIIGGLSVYLQNSYSDLSEDRDAVITLVKEARSYEYLDLLAKPDPYAVIETTEKLDKYYVRQSDAEEALRSAAGAFSRKGWHYGGGSRLIKFEILDAQISNSQTSAQVKTEEQWHLGCYDAHGQTVKPSTDYLFGAYYSLQKSNGKWRIEKFDYRNSSKDKIPKPPSEVLVRFRQVTVKEHGVHEPAPDAHGIIYVGNHEYHFTAAPTGIVEIAGVPCDENIRLKFTYQGKEGEIPLHVDCENPTDLGDLILFPKNSTQKSAALTNQPPSHTDRPALPAPHSIYPVNNAVGLVAMPFTDGQAGAGNWGLVGYELLPNDSPDDTARGFGTRFKLRPNEVMVTTKKDYLIFPWTLRKLESGDYYFFIHKVKPNDSLGELAWRYGVSLDALLILNQNKITNPDELKCDEVKIPLPQ